jgi:hypothetical protein
MTKARNKFSSLSVSTDKTPPHYYNAGCPSSVLSFFYHILSRNPPRPVKAHELENSSICCEVVGNSSLKELIIVSCQLVLKVFTRSCVYLHFLSACVTRQPNPTLSAIWEGLRQWKVPMTPSGIDPATFWFVAQCLNHCATVCPSVLWYPNKFWRGDTPRITVANVPSKLVFY